MTLREAIFSADDIAKEIVEVPEWGVSVEVRAMTAAERAKLGEGAMVGDKTNVGLMYALTVIASIYDPETGLPVFTDNDREAILSKKRGVNDCYNCWITRSSSSNFAGCVLNTR